MYRLCILVFTFLLSSSALGYELIPHHFLVSKAKSTLLNDVIEINNNLSIQDINFCVLGEKPSQDCFESGLSKKYVVMPKSKKAFAIKRVNAGHYDFRKLSASEKDFFDVFFQYMFEQVSIEIGTHSKNNQGTIKVETSTRPHGQDWCSSSPEVFPYSCREHDMCYDSGSPKGVCDDAFYHSMMSEAEAYYNLGPDQKFEPGSYGILATVYYQAVLRSKKALEAFCAATPVEFSICDPNFDDSGYSTDPDEVTGGEKVTDPALRRQVSGSEDGWGGQTGVVDRWLDYGYYVYSCEVWEFPNGEGGYYYMAKECVYSFRQAP
ncbi:hypothetical protein ACSLBF_14655 [Pseudoalteromonas sp. T1lg65]|uniref:hypothetical protein n=1 Tax=Pseudoalteromonas sp. T1lg65 TaxID=2077101 RepID=UPI003F79B59F